MMRVQIKSHAGKAIRTLEDWEKYALPPARKKLHWKKGRSAYELGWSWTSNGEPAVPPELIDLLDSHEGTRGTVILSGVTERETALPFSIRGPRCHDLALLAEQGGCPMTICIEAKADESFGGTVVEELMKAKNRVKEKNRAGTMFPKRLDWLTRSLLGLPAFKDDQFAELSDDVSPLPYQLLPAIGGTLLEAADQKTLKAVFVVHEFRTELTEDAKLEANANALNRFLRLLLFANKPGHEDIQLDSSHMIGPILITDRSAEGPIKIPYHIPLFIGKIRTEVEGHG
jgi:hypothetical protein